MPFHCLRFFKVIKLIIRIKYYYFKISMKCNQRIKPMYELKHANNNEIPDHFQISYIGLLQQA